jgi:GGDEF domain-containing protein
MTKHAITPSTRERRVALTMRRYVAEMSPEEMRRELLTSEVTGLPNRRAFNEAGAALAVAMSDLDGLKALNKYGYEVGNAILKAKGEALREASLEAYHDKGDEFLCRGTHIKELAAKLKRARAILRNRTILVDRADGSAVAITGADFSYGVGQDIDDAESRLRSHKAQRENRGELARGELRRITIEERRSERPSELTPLSRSPHQAAVKFLQQTEDTGSPRLLRLPLPPKNVGKSTRAGSNSLLELAQSGEETNGAFAPFL